MPRRKGYFYHSFILKSLEIYLCLYCIVYITVTISKDWWNKNTLVVPYVCAKFHMVGFNFWQYPLNLSWSICMTSCYKLNLSWSVLSFLVYVTCHFIRNIVCRRELEKWRLLFFLYYQFYFISFSLRKCLTTRVKQQSETFSECS